MAARNSVSMKDVGRWPGVRRDHLDALNKPRSLSPPRPAIGPGGDREAGLGARRFGPAVACRTQPPRSASSSWTSPTRSSAILRSLPGISCGRGRLLGCFLCDSAHEPASRERGRASSSSSSCGCAGNLAAHLDTPTGTSPPATGHPVVLADRFAAYHDSCTCRRRRLRRRPARGRNTCSTGGTDVWPCCRRHRQHSAGRCASARRRRAERAARQPRGHPADPLNGAG